MNELLPEKCLDSQLWHACAGGMVQMPPVSSKVFYFPQGHAEHAVSAVDFPDSPQIPSSILCHVSAVTFLADTETDEVYAKMKLIPLPRNSFDIDDDVITPPESSDKPASFSKTLTQSDANNGGGFSVPRYCAETIFPRLDYSADPPVQTVVARDVHGDTWKFRHIYRGTPRRHLLTTGWSAFVNQKKLVAGDSIVFLRTEKGDLCVGIRRAKRGFCPEPPPWSSGSPYGGKFSMLLREEEDKLARNGFCRNTRSSPERGKVSPETVVEAAVRAARGQSFEVVFYPRANSPEFCIRAGLVKAAMRTQWRSGMRFKMAFETEDSSRISWFMGTISLVHFSDLRWPDSLWRVLQVIWDEPDLLQSVKRVSPWLVELVSTVPVIHMPPLSPPRKKLRPPYPLDFPTLEGHFLSPFSGNFLRPNGPSCFLPTTNPASIQGPRQTFGSFLSDLNNPNNKFHHSGGLFGHFRPTYNPNPNPNPIPNHNPNFRIPEPTAPQYPNDNEGLSCLLTIGTTNPSLVRDKPRNPSKKRSQFLLFGQTILTEQQMSDKIEFPSSEETGHCKVFLESEDVGRTLDLSSLASYEELYLRLIHMFGIERSNPLSSFLYQDATGAFQKVGDKPFSEFARTAKRLTIMLDSGNKNVERAMLPGNGFVSAAKAGALSTYA